jgi:pimeloyl-ACP methyl ester carboxylesterase
MRTTRTVKWHEVDHLVSNLRTDHKYEIRVQREAIPLVFVPGIMGSRLRVAGTDGTGEDPDGFPNMRWNPSSKITFMLPNFTGAEAAFRRRMLVGKGNFFKKFLEVDNPDQVGDGIDAIYSGYKGFLKSLRNYDWGPLQKIFVFPVYAVGYNWTDSNDNSGKKLAGRISQIIQEATSITGLCEKVILITHSMGGLVARAASQFHDAQSNILGIIHGVQPINGSPAAYWRMKAGFEGALHISWTLGSTGPTVTCVLANVPGGLELLPNKKYITNSGQKAWLSVTDGQKTILSLPKSNPYEEIYRVKARVQPTPGENPSSNKYWGLVDPDLLAPGIGPAPPNAPLNRRDPDTFHDAAHSADGQWQQFLDLLADVETFHDKLGQTPHPHTFCFAGVGHESADAIELQIESNIFTSNPYPTRGFRGFFTDAAGNSMKAVLQDPSGDGDGTVPFSSASALNKSGKRPPGDLNVEVKHQPAYESDKVLQYAVQAIIALAKVRYESVRGKIKD